MATLGKTNIGASSALITKWWSCKFTAGGVGGTITDMNFYGEALGTPVNFKLCIWADSSGSPGTLLAQSGSTSINTTTQWWTASVSYTFSASEVLHLGYVTDDWVNVYRDAGSTNQFTEFTQDYTGWPTTPNPPTVDGQYDFEISIYANYTPASSNTTNFFF